MTKARLSTAGVILLFAAVLFLIAAEIVPLPTADRGVYVSVGHRLLAGDRLYADVFDNKDPLFFYAIAASEALGPWFSLVLEAIFTLGTAILAGLIARRIYEVGVAAFAGLTMAALLIVTAAHYDRGGTIAMANFLTVLSAYLVVQGRPRAAGMGLFALAFAKVVMLPMAAIFSLIFASMAKDRQGAINFISTMIASAAAACAVFLAILFVRGELTAYVDMQLGNFLYASNNIMTATSLVENIANHLTAVLKFGKRLLLLAAGSLAASAIALRRNDLPPKGRALIAAGLASLSLTLAVLAFVGIWPHHVSMLYPALILLLMGSVPALCAENGGRVVALALCAVPLTLVAMQREWASPLLLPDRLAQLAAVGPETAAFQQVVGRRQVRYARIGPNNDFAHGRGLNNAELICPRFHLYPFYPDAMLDQAIRCASRADVLIVHLKEGDRYYPEGRNLPWLPPHADISGANRRWARLTAKTEALLKHDFTCRDFASNIKICRRRG